MGGLTSRQNVGAEEIDISSLHVYRYPPKNGCYFGNHFIMGGEKFDTPQPESYLFGENSDLNFLGSRPTPFPYPPPQSNEPTKTLKSRVNIRKESLRMVRVNSPVAKDETTPTQPVYNIEFIFDTDCQITITIYYFVTEEVTPNGIVFLTKDSSTSSSTYHYSTGANQVFYQPSHIFDPNKYSLDELSYSVDKEVIPVAIHCVTEDANDLKQSHTTIAIIDRHSDGSFVLKPLKQKIFVDGLSYLLQEIYGIENKQMECLNNRNITDVDIEGDEDNGSECVICMSDIRDTLILPCRHLCLCNSCADSLRYQANNCPICRSPFRALLQIKALRKNMNVTGDAANSTDSSENIPPGYEAVSLIEALNGPYMRALKERTDSDKTTRRKRRKSYDSIKLKDESNDAHTDISIKNSDESNENEIDSSPLLFVKRNKDSIKTVDETQRLSPLTISNSRDDADEEVDSEAEKLSPLLSGERSNDEDTNSKINSGKRNNKNNKKHEVNDDERSNDESGSSHD